MKNIAVFTGGRSDYGILSGLVAQLEKNRHFRLQLYVGGAHLAPEQGLTIQEIIADKIKITETFDYLLASDAPIAVIKSMALAQMIAAEAFHRNRPDVLILLGDRFEALAIAQAAIVSGIPIAHLHGGEITEGALDDSFRHCITKLSHLHFVANEIYRKRVIQLGENPEHVHNVGALALDNIKKRSLLSRDELAKILDFDLGKKYFVLTYHPATLVKSSELHGLQNLLMVLQDFPDHKIVMTYTNTDIGGKKFVRCLEQFAKSFPKRTLLIESLGQRNYLSLLKSCDCVLGNSSSGLIEAPSFHVPTVNVGERQKGRVAGDTVINTGTSMKEIAVGLTLALSAEFRRKCKFSKNPYGEGTATKKILSVLSTIKPEELVAKKFYDFKNFLE